MIRRMRGEYKLIHEFNNLIELGIYIDFGRGSYDKLYARVEGPEGSPYEGGIFELAIIATPQFPFIAPKIQFVTQIWHPRINKEGYINLDPLLKWRPDYLFEFLLTEVYKCLETGFDITHLSRKEQSKRVANYEAWLKFKTNKIAFIEKAKQMTKLYAQKISPHNQN